MDRVSGHNIHPELPEKEGVLWKQPDEVLFLVVLNIEYKILKVFGKPWLD